MTLINCQNLTVGYDSKSVFKGLSFSVNSGDYICIAGENGSGKSTLMKTMLGLQPPLAGSITMGEGVSLNDVGYMPQQTAVQKDFPASVREIVISGCRGRMRVRPFYGRSEKRRAEEMMEKLGIIKLADRSYRELSGGQQQRVLLARALCAAQKMLFLDEPAAGLDYKATTEMYRIIKKINEEDGITVLMISHDIASASHATHFLHIGDSFFFGDRQEYIQGGYRQQLVGVEEVGNHG